MRVKNNINKQEQKLKLIYEHVLSPRPIAYYISIEVGGSNVVTAVESIAFVYKDTTQEK